MRIKKKAQSTIEYLTLVAFIMGALLVSQKYIARAINGRWKGVGESFGFGRQYDPKKTIECAYDFQFLNVWYNAVCYEQRCDCQSVRATNVTCENCIISCQTLLCN